MFFFFSPSLCIFVDIFVKGMIVSGLYGLLIMSSMSCYVFFLFVCLFVCFLCIFVLMYDIGIKFDIIDMT